MSPLLQQNQQTTLSNNKYKKINQKTTDELFNAFNSVTKTKDVYSVYKRYGKQQATKKIKGTFCTRHRNHHCKKS